MTRRDLELSPERLVRWWDTFHREHPGVSTKIDDGEVVLASTDGTMARFRGWFPVTEGMDPLAELSATPGEVGIILLRRGGFSLGHATGVGTGQMSLARHKSGTRYVQGRTAAGGWSQQRFARRRQNQADELVNVAADHAVRVLEQILSRAEGAGLAVGGDALLIDSLLDDPRLTPLKSLPRRTFDRIPDPRHKVLVEVAKRLAFVQVAVHNP